MERKNWRSVIEEGGASCKVHADQPMAREEAHKLARAKALHTGSKVSVFRGKRIGRHEATYTPADGALEAMGIERNPTSAV